MGNMKIQGGGWSFMYSREKTNGVHTSKKLTVKIIAIKYRFNDL